MTEQEFINDLKEILDVDELNAEHSFSDFPDFDSLAIMSIVALVFSKFRKKITGAEVKKAVTVKDLILLIGSEHFEGAR